MRRGVSGAAVAALLIVGLAPAASSDDPFIVRAGKSATSETSFALGKAVEVTVGGTVTQTGGTPPITCTRDAFYHVGCDNSPGKPSPADFGLAAEDASNKGGSARLDTYTRSRVVPPYRSNHVYTILIDNARGKLKFKAYPFGGISPGALDTYGGSFKVAITPPKPVPPPKPPRTEVAGAIDWAEDEIGSERWRGRCQRFVETAYGARTGYKSANEASEAIGLRSGPATSVPKGALIYFKPNCPGATGRYGHVGISLGNGKMVSALGEVTVTDLRTNNRWRSRYSGWTYPPASWPGR